MHTRELKVNGAMNGGSAAAIVEFSNDAFARVAATETIVLNAAAKTYALKTEARYARIRLELHSAPGAKEPPSIASLELRADGP